VPVEPVQQKVEHVHLSRSHVVETDRVVAHHVVRALPLSCICTCTVPSSILRIHQSINQSIMYFRVVQVAKSLQDPLEVHALIETEIQRQVNNNFNVPETECSQLERL